MRQIKIQPKYILFGIAIFGCFSLISCKKYLDEKPLKTTVVPETLGDLQALLDYYTNMNQKSPQLLEALSDNYFITTATYNQRSVNDRMNYTWDKDATEYNNWFTPYTGPIYYANVVLDELPRVSTAGSTAEAYNKVKGAALFFRAFNFYQIAQCYCLPYSQSTIGEPGIVLRLTSNINIPSVRSTVGETYLQIIKDYKEAAALLPETTLYPTQPNKIAAQAALARTYLAMQDYPNARLYADSVLTKYNQLLNYNTLSSTANPIFQTFNKETIFYSRTTSSNLTLNLVGSRADSNLVKTYGTNDLRKSLFYSLNADNTYSFRGSYEGSANGFWVFDGIATDEVYLIRSECAARAGDKDAALADLNSLLATRWKTNFFTPFTASTAPEAVSIILAERRKELVHRGLRWTDLRRLNLDGANITLKRVVNGVEYSLPPNDPRWVLLIPQEVLTLTSMPQNPR